MIPEVYNKIVYGITFLSLFIIDYLLGNGFVDAFQKIFCGVVCFVYKSIREEEKHLEIVNDTVSLSVLVADIVFLGLTIFFLNKYKQYRGKDRIDDLLQESREALRQTNEFLEKWRLRRINMHPTEHSYLDEEPQEIRPFKLEVPILQMAIVDTLGATRSQPGSGDAADPVNITDSTLLTMTSLLDDDFDLLSDTNSNDKIDETKDAPIRNRLLWDVLEEDAAYLDE